MAREKNSELVHSENLDHLRKEYSTLRSLYDNILIKHNIVKNKLFEKENLLNLMGATAKVGGWEFDVDTQKQNWTDETYSIHEIEFDFDPNVSNGISFYSPHSKTIIENAVKRAIEFGEPFDLELEIITNKGNRKWVHSIGNVIQENKKTIKVFGSCQDITERKYAELLSEMSKKILITLSGTDNFKESIKSIIHLIKDTTNLDAVAIRIKEGDDYPYFFSEGFPNDFLSLENSIIVRNKEGGVCRDCNGNVSLECTCGLVISGKTDPSNPLFTNGGSSWTNNSFPFLHLSIDEDPRTNPRNLCIHKGYASVALIPIRANNIILGLLQLNDKRKDCFKLSQIELFETITEKIGSAYLRKKEEQELKLAYTKLNSLWNIAKHANEEFKSMCDSIIQNLVEMTNSRFGFFGFMNTDETVMTIHSWSGEAMKGCSILNKPTDFSIESAGVWGLAVKNREPFILNNYSKFHIGKKGFPFGNVAISNLLVVPQFYKGKIVSIAAVANRADDYNEYDITQINAFVGGIQQITELKRTENELIEYKNRLEELVKVRTKKLDIANQELLKQIEKEKEYRFLLKNALDKEIDLNKIKSSLIATASHEFRTPLTSILSSTELLQRYGNKWSEEKKDEHVDRIKRKVDYLTKLLDDVLLISEKEAGKIGFNPRQINMRLLVQECLDDAKSNMKESHKVILSYLCQNEIFIADRKLTKFIISNLLSNSIKFSPHGGNVKLEICNNDECITIAVTDQGLGIPNSEVSLIFQAFYRASNVKAISGSGLGLAIVNHAVKLHSGTISVDSKEGIGTTFTVTIPINA